MYENTRARAHARARLCLIKREAVFGKGRAWAWARARARNRIRGSQSMLPKYRKPTHPGQILLEEFLEPMGITQAALARHLGWSYAKLNEIIHGKRGISLETAIQLGMAFKMTPIFWLNLQLYYDLWEVQRHIKEIEPIHLVG